MMAPRKLAALGLAALLPAASAAPLPLECTSGVDGPLGCDADAAAAGVGLLQVQAARGAHGGQRAVSAQGARGEATAEAGARSKDELELVLMHVPFNFGHTIERVAMFGTGAEKGGTYGVVTARLEIGGLSTDARWNLVNKTKRPDAEIWGHMNPDLFDLSEVTGCPLYFTPGKYWPKEKAEAYFGDKTVFGMLRDPYERLVALFRGNFGSYGGSYPEFFKTCDVNGAVRKMMTDYLAGDQYSGQCTFIPQAEYFDAPFGIQLAVDNSGFPDSANAVFAQFGYDDMHIAQEDIMHVFGCPDVWAGDLDCETKALVKKVYARDFELLCSKFGYCDSSENTCIQGVTRMCPPDLEAKKKTATHCK